MINMLSIFKAICLCIGIGVGIVLLIGLVLIVLTTISVIIEFIIDKVKDKLDE